MFKSGDKQRILKVAVKGWREGRRQSTDKENQTMTTDLT